MTRFEYIKEIEKFLKTRLPENELYDIMRDYAEFFEEGKKQGKTEEEIMTSLGTPKSIAEGILSEEILEVELPKKAKVINDNTKKATQDVMNGIKNTSENISKATKDATSKIKEKSITRSEIRKEQKQQKREYDMAHPKQETKLDATPLIGAILGIFVYPMIIGVSVLGLCGLIFFVSAIFIISFMSVFISITSIAVLTVASLSILVLSIFAVLLSIWLFLKYNKAYFAPKEETKEGKNIFTKITFTTLIIGISLFVASVVSVPFLAKEEINNFIEIASGYMQSGEQEFETTGVQKLVYDSTDYSRVDIHTSDSISQISIRYRGNTKGTINFEAQLISGTLSIKQTTQNDHNDDIFEIFGSEIYKIDIYLPSNVAVELIGDSYSNYEYNTETNTEPIYEIAPTEATSSQIIFIG